jgi:hypothetical protein
MRSFLRFPVVRVKLGGCPPRASGADAVDPTLGGPFDSLGTAGLPLSVS